MVDRFVQYSMENEKKIAAFLMTEEGIVKKNMQVLAIDEDGQGLTVLLSGKKKPSHLAMEALLTADYARGDHGALE